MPAWRLASAGARLMPHGWLRAWPGPGRWRGQAEPGQLAFVCLGAGQVRNSAGALAAKAEPAAAADLTAGGARFGRTQIDQRQAPARRLASAALAASPSAADAALPTRPAGQ
jgi:hypothetical protein